MKPNNKFDELKSIISELREKCPWDKKQTFSSLRRLTVEEVYELSEEIINKKHSGIEEEVGDLLLHVMLYSQIGEEQNKFDINSIIEKLILKLKRRHPHIYENKQDLTAEEVESNWEKIKKTEKNIETTLGNIPKSIPPMIKAIRIQEKVKSVGFDWDEMSQVIEKIKEEFNEVKEEIKKLNNDKKIKNEIGDLMFSVINLARFIGIDPEESLERTNIKFINRFNEMERKVQIDRKNLKDMSLKEMDRYWEKSKKKNEEQ
tara:strand:- start:12809 stop:13588 length:780 start_codon:yes stop_codon:yes gene_type:complete